MGEVNSKYDFLEKVNFGKSENLKIFEEVDSKSDELFELLEEFKIFLDIYRDYNPKVNRFLSNDEDDGFKLLDIEKLTLTEEHISKAYLRSMATILNVYTIYENLSKHNIQTYKDLEKIGFFEEVHMSREEMKEIFDNINLVKNIYSKIQVIGGKGIFNFSKLFKEVTSRYKLTTLEEVNSAIDYKLHNVLNDTIGYVSDKLLINEFLLKVFLYEKENSLDYLLKFAYFQKRYSNDILFLLFDIVTSLKKIYTLRYNPKWKFVGRYNFFDAITDNLLEIFDKKEKLDHKLKLFDCVSKDTYELICKLNFSDKDITFLSSIGVFKLLDKIKDKDRVTLVLEKILENKYFLQKNNYDFNGLELFSFLKLVDLLDERLDFETALFVLEKKYETIENIGEKIKYLKKLQKNYSNEKIKKILKLDIKFIENLSLMKFDNILVDDIISGKISISDLEFIRKKQNFIDEINSKLAYLPDVSYLSEKNKILNLLNEINLDNFLSKTKEIEKNIDNLATSIELAGDLVSYFGEELFFALYNFFYLKKNKKNKLNAKLTLKVLQNLKGFDISKISEFLTIISKKTVNITESFVANSDSVFKTIFSNFNIFVSFVSNYKGQLSLLKIQDMIDEKSKKEILNDLINVFFPEDIIDFLDSVKNTSKMDILIDLAKNLNFKNIDENLILEVIIYEKNDLLLLLNYVGILQVLGFDLNQKSEDILKNFDYLLNKDKSKLNEFVNFAKKGYLEVYSVSEIWLIMQEYFYGDLNLDTIIINENDEEESLNLEETYKGIKGLGGMSGKEILSVLNKLGFEEKKIRGKTQGKGDHKLLIRENELGKTYIMIPMHASVKASTLKDQLKKAGILNEFTSFLGLQ